MLFCSTGSVWRANRRNALHVLHDFGFGRNMMEVKVALVFEFSVDINPQTDNATGRVAGGADAQKQRLILRPVRAHSHRRRCLSQAIDETSSKANLQAA